MFKNNRSQGNDSWKSNDRGFGGKSFGGNRGGFGGNRGGRGGFGGGKPAFQEKCEAVCNECGETCFVPFKPNGRKPVLCSNCFRQEGGSSERKSFDRDEKPAYRSTPRVNNDAMVDQLKSIDAKLGAILKALTKDAE